MAPSLKPARFYGRLLPRPRIYVDVKFNQERVDPPSSVNGALLEWAGEAHWTMGGLSHKRKRMQGKIEGRLSKLRDMKEDDDSDSSDKEPALEKTVLSGKKGQKLSIKSKENTTQSSKVVEGTSERGKGLSLSKDDAVALIVSPPRILRSPKVKASPSVSAKRSPSAGRSPSRKATKSPSVVRRSTRRLGAGSGAAEKTDKDITTPGSDDDDSDDDLDNFMERLEASKNNPNHTMRRSARLHKLLSTTGHTSQKSSPARKAEFKSPLSREHAPLSDSDSGSEAESESEEM